MVHQATLKFETAGRSFTNITALVEAQVAASRVGTGLCSVFIRHTSASLIIPTERKQCHPR